jgi:hypothetical protein
MFRSSKAAFVIAVTTALAMPSVVQAGPWVALPPQSLEVKAGSALDFSGLAPVDLAGKPVPAGQFGPVRIGMQGKFVFQKKPNSPVRFLAASFGVSPASGSIPDAATSKRLARQLRLAGYNLVRFHMVDAVLMNKTRANLVFDPVQLGRLHALLAFLKNEGIYWMFDGLSSSKGGFSNSIVDKNKDQWAPSPFDVKTGVYISDMYREHYKELVRKLFLTVNPHTHLSIIDDPALAGVILVNEGGINFSVLTMGNPTVRVALGRAFNQWLKTKYVTTEKLQKAWGSAGPDNFDATTESLEQENVQLPTNIHVQSARNIDAQKFFIDREAETTKWMTKFFVTPKSEGGLGYEGPITSLNNWSSLQANLSRSQFPWVDLHVYFDDPSRFANNASTIRQVSSLYDPDPKFGPEGAPQRSLNYVELLAANRHAGKPFSVSEYGHVFWSAWRREALALASYASLQDWDMICQFNEPVILPSADENLTPSRHRAIYPYHVGLDPIAKVTETLAALLFLRGDVAPSKSPVVFKIDANNFQPPNSSMGSAGGLRYSIAGLSLLTRIGVVVGSPAGTAAVATPTERLPEPWRSPRKLVALNGTETIEKIVESLSSAGALPKYAATNLANSIYESDTKQLLLRARERSLQVVTPRTEAVSFDAKIPQGLQRLGIEKSDTPAVVALSALDDNVLENSERMLLMVSTDAINSDMTFRVTGKDGIESIKRGELVDYTDRKVLHDLGHLPVLLKSAHMTLKIRNANFRSLAVYALALNGERMTKLSQVRETANGEILIDIDTEKNPTTYFEIVTSLHQ